MKKAPILLLIFLLVPSVLATVSIPEKGLTQNHYYSVFFDREGTAIVATKLQIRNDGTEPLEKIEIDIPGTDVKMSNAIQQHTETNVICFEWGDVCRKVIDGICEDYKRECKRWTTSQKEPPRYYSIDMQPNVLQDSTEYIVNLPKPVGYREIAFVILYYKAEGYVERGLGAHRFVFETIKVPYNVSKVRVAINVQPGLYMKGGEPGLDYKESFAILESKFVSGTQNEMLENFAARMEWQPGYEKITYGLKPGESFHIKGKYGTSRFALYKPHITVTFFFIVAIIVGIVLFIRRGWFIFSKNATVVFVGFLSAFVIMTYALVLSFLVRYVNITVNYYLRSIVIPLMLIFSAAFLLVVLFWPTVYMGIRHSLVTGVLTTVSTMGWVLIIAAIFAVLLSVLSPETEPVYVIIADIIKAGL